MPQPFLEEFEAHAPELKKAGDELAARLTRELAALGLSTHFVTWRLKSAASLAEKLARPDRTYRSLWHVTDLIGVRVAVAFDEDVARVSRLVEDLFRVDFLHSSARVKPVGYRSVHYVVAFDGAPHADARAEIQIRTALQHAWAEVEHDLGYKASDAVPEHLRHRFARVAGLLEIADAEFVAIRRELAAVREETRARLASGVALDLLSLEELLKHPGVSALDAQLGEALAKEVSGEPFGATYLVNVLRAAGLSETRDVLTAVEAFGPYVSPSLRAYFEFARAELNFSPSGIDVVRRGYGLLFVALLSVVRSPGALGLDKVARLARVYEATEFQGDFATAQRVAGALLKALG